MLKTLKTTAFCLLFSATHALAGSAPWEGRSPSGMTSQHQQFADQAYKVSKKVGFGIDPRTANWNKRLSQSPASNVSASNLKKHLTGRYHVFNEPGSNKWSVRYYASDGTTHFCTVKNGRYREYTLQRHVQPVEIGLSGTMHLDTVKRTNPGDKKGWPLIVDAATGEVATYFHAHGKWKMKPGWIQEEYASGWAKQCPKLPKSGKVSNQSGNTYAEMARGARKVQIPASFQSSIRNPLTGEMFYHLHAPR